jgi:hypothetical protein
MDNQQSLNPADSGHGQLTAQLATIFPVRCRPVPRREFRKPNATYTQNGF